MIRIFGQTDTDFTTNGDCVLQPLKAIVHQYQNSDFYIELEASLDYAQWFEQGRLVVADYLNTQQIFRMWNVVKVKDRVKAKCWHVFYDLKYRINPPPALDEGIDHETQYDNIYDILCDGYDLHSSWAEIPEAIGASGFTIRDFSQGSQFDYIWLDLEKYFRGKSMYDIIQQLLNEFEGSQLYINKFSFGIKYLWADNPEREFEIRYGKNLKEITKEEDWSEVCTTLCAIGKDGLTKTYTNSVQYDFPYPKIVKFQQSITAENYASDAAYQQALIADLDSQAAAYLKTNKVPKIKYSVKAYIANIMGLPEVLLGDEIDVIDEPLGINVRTKVIGIDYDINAKTYENLTFGNYTSNTMKGYNQKLQTEFNNAQNNVSLLAYPVGSEYVTYSQKNPNKLGIDGSWSLISSSGGKYTWRRVS